MSRLEAFVREMPRGSGEKEKGDPGESDEELVVRMCAMVDTG